MLDKSSLILGGPGCGKTTRLIDIVRAELYKGIPSDRIAFVAFTKAAAEEAKLRASETFQLDAEKELPWFRTIHSLTYARLGIQRDEVMGWKDWRDFAQYAGYALTGRYDNDAPAMSTDKLGDQMLRVIDFANATTQTLEAAYDQLECNFHWYQLQQFRSMYLHYKAETGKIDFGDMLSVYSSGESEPLDVDVAIIDEAQDLTAAQWAVVRKAFANVQRIYIAGDDDQAIYRWAGADIDAFLSLKGSREVLPLSHRLPVKMFDLANKVSGRISRRFPKQFLPTGRAGEVYHHMSPDGLDLSSGSWLLLARNNYMLPEIEQMVRSYGVNYATHKGPAVNQGEVAGMHMWEALRSGKRATLSAKEARIIFKLLDKPTPQLRELNSYTPVQLALPTERIWHEAFQGIPSDRREFYISCLRRKEKLSAAPRVRIETIHGVKGKEADNVMIMTDISARTERSFQADPDNEHRVFYVGVTRARETLHIIAPQSASCYTI